MMTGRRPVVEFLVVTIVAACVVFVLVLRYLPERGEENDTDKATAPFLATKFSLIEEGLYMGGYVEKPPPGTEAVLNLCKNADDYRCEFHVHKPIADAAPAPKIDWLREQVAWIDAQRRAGRITYV